MQRLLLIDGNAILHRAFHALPEMINSQGQHTNAIYGFISMLFRVIKELKPTHIAVAFDRPKPTFRTELFKQYQAHRPKMDEALVSQISEVHRVLEAMQIPIFELDGYEADDVIGTIAKKFQPKADHALRDKVKNQLDDIVVVTGDRDLLQIVNSHVKLFMPVKGLSEAKLYGEAEAKARMGVPPVQIPDFKALAGDASDNYPGVAGIGPKTAIALLEQFGTVENIYKNLDKVKNPAIVEKLTKDKANALLSHKLATILTDIPVTLDSEKTQMHDLATEAAIAYFQKLEFKTLLQRLLNLNVSEEKPSKKVIQKKDDQLGLF